MKAYLGRLPRSILVSVTALGFWGAPQLMAQQEAPYQFKKPLEHQVSVVLKLIQVSATDRRGNPITDLTRDDFVVYDNGRRVLLSAFEKHEFAVPAASKPIPVPVPFPTLDIPARTDEPPVPSLPRKFLFFFDFAFNTSKGVEKAMIAARHFLDKTAKPTDEIGLASFSLFKGMKIHEFFTTDHAKIRLAISDLSVKSAAGRFEDMEARYWSEFESQQMNSDAEFNNDAKRINLTMARGELKTQIRLYLNLLIDLSRALRYVPGQKNLIAFSTGIPNSIINGTGLRGMGSEPLGDVSLRLKSEEAIRQVGAAGITYFSFDTREQGKNVDLFGTDEDRLGDSRAPRDMLAVEAFNLIPDEKLTGRNTLEHFADMTGGKYFGNIREYEKSLDQVQSLTGTFYVLGYSVEERADGEYHEIKVETKRQGTIVHTQAGFFNPKPFVEFSRIEKDLHLFDLAYSEKPLFQAPLKASLITLEITMDSAAHLVFLAKIPPETIEKMAQGKTEIVTFVFDEAGGLADLRRSEHPLAAFKDRTVLITSKVGVAPGSYQGRIVIRNLATGTSATASAPVFFAKAPDPGLFLQKPLLLLPCENEAYLHLQNRSGTSAPWNEIYPFDVNRYTPVLDPVTRGTASIFVLLPYKGAGIESPRVNFRIVAVNGETGIGTELNAVLFDPISREGFFVQAFEVSIGRLASGRYILYFYAEAAGAKTLSHTVSPLTIR